MELSRTALIASLIAGFATACTTGEDPLPASTTGRSGDGGGVPTGSSSGGGSSVGCQTAADCDPDFLCTGMDCVGGRCLDGVPPRIDDGNRCTVDACDPKTGVTHTEVDPSDDDECTTDTCGPGVGLIHTPVDPNDHNLCTVDTCDPKTGVKHAPLATIDDGNLCHDNHCDPKTGEISHTPKADCYCAHSACEEGVALDPSTCTFGPTSHCVAEVCQKNATCCTQGWTAECIALAKDPTVCSANPGGFSCTCTHPPTCAGVALFSKCDPCVQIVCEAFPKCCNLADPQGWSNDCVAATKQLCNAKIVLNCP